MDSVPVFPHRPLWSDRQLIAAADLSAEQSWQDAQLARLRRYALGWGVVAGFEVTHDGDTLIINPGYAISPFGHEVYLNARLAWKEFLTDLRAVCDQDNNQDCDNPNDRTDENDPSDLGAWLVVQPETVESCPRPTVASGCANPGNTWALSRQGGALQFKISCTLEAGLLPDARLCPDVQALFKAGAVPMPPDIPDIVPLAHIRCAGRSIAEITIANRRRLLPLSEVAAALACCDCTTDDVVIPPPPPPPPPESVWKQPREHSMAKLFEDIAGFLPDGSKDLKRTLSKIFKANILRQDPRLGVAVRDPVQAFAAAAMVITEDELRLWADGDYPKIYKGATAKPLIRDAPNKGIITGSMTLDNLLDVSPNIHAFVATYGDQNIADLTQLVRKAKNKQGQNPGVVAVLGFVLLRFDQMGNG